MWDTVPESTAGSQHLSHEMPCPWCGHCSHSYLPCSDRCSCSGWKSFGERDLATSAHE
jgi:hypothetical protein